MRLQDIDAEVIASFQGEMIQAGAKSHAVRKPMVLLGGILQRAAEGRRIPYNPQRVVRKARLPLPPEVRPFAPITVERLRAQLDHRDPTIVSVLAYARLRPGELRTLTWDAVREGALMIDAPKTGQRRRVRPLGALESDLKAWRDDAAPLADSPVFPDVKGQTWTANGFEKWRQRVFTPAVGAIGLPKARPYDLRHSFASLASSGMAGN